MASALVCMTFPTTTCPMVSLSTPLCSRAAFAATTARSVAVRLFSEPSIVPKAVRLAPRMTRGLGSLDMGTELRLMPRELAHHVDDLLHLRDARPFENVGQPD